MTTKKRVTPSIYKVNSKAILRTATGELRLNGKHRLLHQLAKDYAEIYGYPVICVQKGIIKR